MAFLIGTIIDKLDNQNGCSGKQPLEAFYLTEFSDRVCCRVDFAVQHNLVLALTGIEEDVVIPTPTNDSL